MLLPQAPSGEEVQPPAPSADQQVPAAGVQSEETALGAETAKTLHHVRLVGSKARTRLASQALRQLHTVQARTTDTIDAMRPYTVDLIGFWRRTEREASALGTAAAETAAPAAAESRSFLSTAKDQVTRQASRLPAAVRGPASALGAQLAARLADSTAIMQQTMGYLTSLGKWRTWKLLNMLRVGVSLDV
jgi:hypothetical protein